MAKSKIEWTDKVWNPVTGCTKIGEGCRNCYAERMSKRLKGRCGYPSDDPFKVTMHPERLKQPINWNKPSKIFVCSMGDLFHPDVPDDFIDKVFIIMKICKDHTFFVLTKRPDRMADYINKRFFHEIMPIAFKNVWLGTSVENEKTASERIQSLIETGIKNLFLSIEPCLSLISFRWKYIADRSKRRINKDGFKETNEYESLMNIKWVIVGGESGPNARPCHPEWVRKLREQCKLFKIPFFFKQWGEWKPIMENAMNVVPEKKYCAIDINGKELTYLSESIAAIHVANFKKTGKKQAGNLLDGKVYNEFPKFNN